MTTWWIFYPVKGLDIADERPDLDAPMFGDATLISKKHIRQVVPLLKLNEGGVSGHDHEKDVTYILEHATFKEEFHSMIAVKRKGPIEPIQAQSTLDSPFRKLSILAEKRASKIAALLSLSVLSESKDWNTCALVEQIHRRYQTLAMLALDTGGFSYQTGGHQSHTIHGKPIVLLRTELRSKLEAQPIAPLSAVLMPQKPPIADSLASAIIESSIRLSDAIHSPSAAGQLLGTVTSIEILITNQGDSFETTKRRIMTIVGQNAFDFYEAEQILNERHLYVHRGAEPSHGKLPTKATGLALSCILQYSMLAPRFSDRNALITYLDFVHLGRRMEENWSVEEKENFGQLVKHKAIQNYFRFFTENTMQQVNNGATGASAT